MVQGHFTYPSSYGVDQVGNSYTWFRVEGSKLENGDNSYAMDILFVVNYRNKELGTSQAIIYDSKGEITDKVKKESYSTTLSPVNFDDTVYTLICNS